jgi:hypothetical protein
MEEMITKLASSLEGKKKMRHRSGSISSDIDSAGEELETTVTLDAGRTPNPRPLLQRSKARRTSLVLRTQQVQEAARSANREVLGLDHDRLHSAEAFLSSVNDEVDDVDEEEHKVNNTHTQSHHNEQTNKGKRIVLLKPRAGADKRARPSSCSDAADGLHPDLFSPAYDESESVISLLSKSLSAGVKSKKKFANKTQLHELLIKGRKHAMEADGVTELLAGSSTAAWLEYESYLYRLVIEKGYEAADWYHRQLFERIQLGHHDLSKNGTSNSELIRELDRQWAWLPESQLTSRKVGSSSNDRFRTRTSSGNGNNNNSRNGSSGAGKQAKQQAAFSGVPCKHHGPLSRHTTADCKDPKASGASQSA